MTTLTCDVVVAGLGGAGAMAAIAAGEKSAHVIVVERTDDGSGSTRDSGRNIRTFNDAEMAIEHYAHLSYESTAFDVIPFVHSAQTEPLLSRANIVGRRPTFIEWEHAKAREPS